MSASDNQLLLDPTDETTRRTGSDAGVIQRWPWRALLEAGD